MNSLIQYIIPLNWYSIDTCLLSNNIMDYHVVSQGKTSIPGVDDGEEFKDADVSTKQSNS